MQATQKVPFSADHACDFGIYETLCNNNLNRTCHTLAFCAYRSTQAASQSRTRTTGIYIVQEALHHVSLGTREGSLMLVWGPIVHNSAASYHRKRLHTSLILPGSFVYAK